MSWHLKWVRNIELFMGLHRIVYNPKQTFEFYLIYNYYSRRSVSLCNALYTPAAIIPPNIGATQ
jgi:hypothetical protein